MKNCVIIVDFQYDFANPKGSLYVKDAETLIEPVNKFMVSIKDKAFLVFSKDWHPYNHSSFVANKGIWPSHCVAGEDGSKLLIKSNNVDMIINKGISADKEEYSCIKNEAIKKLVLSFDNIFVCGLAKDFCVKNTLLDLQEGGNLYLIEDLSKSVFPEKDKYLIEELKAKNIKIIDTKKAESLIKEG